MLYIVQSSSANSNQGRRVVMKSVTLITLRMVYLVVFLTGRGICIKGWSRDDEKNFYHVTANGQDIGCNLILAGIEAGLSSGDIVFVAQNFNIDLPGYSRTIYEPRSQANRFTTIPK